MSYKGFVPKNWCQNWCDLDERMETSSGECLNATSEEAPSSICGSLMRSSTWWRRRFCQRAEDVEAPSRTSSRAKEEEPAEVGGWLLIWDAFTSSNEHSANQSFPSPWLDFFDLQVSSAAVAEEWQVLVGASSKCRIRNRAKHKGWRTSTESNLKISAAQI